LIGALIGTALNCLVVKGDGWEFDHVVRLILVRDVDSSFLALVATAVGLIRDVQILSQVLSLAQIESFAAAAAVLVH
jgi:hypothetical protein